MQIFNPRTVGYEEMALYEVEDAVAVYDEMLAAREFLEEGEVMNLEIPRIQENGVIWSGLRSSNRAVVRTFKQGGGRSSVTIEPWPNRRTRLTATAIGETYLLKLEDDQTVSSTKAALR